MLCVSDRRWNSGPDRRRADPPGDACPGGWTVGRRAADAAGAAGRSGRSRPRAGHGPDRDLSGGARAAESGRRRRLFSVSFLRPDVHDRRSGHACVVARRCRLRRADPRPVRRTRPRGVHARRNRWQRGRTAPDGGRRSVLLETVDRHAFHRPGLRRRVLQRGGAAAVHAGSLLPGRADGRLPVYLAQAVVCGRDDAGQPGRRHPGAPAPAQRARREHRGRRPAESRRVSRSLRRPPAAAVQ